MSGLVGLHPDAVSADDRASIRTLLDEAGWRPSSIADRYRHETVAIDHPVVDAFATLAGPGLTRVAHRFVRLGHGDYELLKGDALSRLKAPHVELLVDLSEAPTGEAEVHYTVGLVLPQLPGAIAIVERDEQLFRWQRYLSMRVGEARVYRLWITMVRA